MGYLFVVMTVILSVLSDLGSSKPVHLVSTPDSVIVDYNLNNHSSTPTGLPSILHSTGSTGMGRTGTVHCWGENGTPPHATFSSVTHAACRALIHSLLDPPLPSPMSYMPQLPRPSWVGRHNHCWAWLTPFPGTEDNSDPISRLQMYRWLGEILRGCTSPLHPDQGGFISIQNGAWGLNLVAYAHLPEAVSGPAQNRSIFGAK